MEPLNDRELNQLLQQWKAPATPAGIERRVLRRSEPWWRWLIVGAIRVPVPVALAMVAVLALLFYFRTSDKPKPAQRRPHRRPAQCLWRISNQSGNWSRGSLGGVMKLISVLLSAGLLVPAFGQTGVIAGGQPFRAKNSRFYWQSRLEPPSPPLANKPGIRIGVNDKTGNIYRVMIDRTDAASYSGYEVRVRASAAAQRFPDDLSPAGSQPEGAGERSISIILPRGRSETLAPRRRGRSIRFGMGRILSTLWT